MFAHAGVVVLQAAGVDTPARRGRWSTGRAKADVQIIAFIAVCILWAGDGEVVADLGGDMVGSDLCTAEGGVVAADQGGAGAGADMAGCVAGRCAVALAVA